MGRTISKACPGLNPTAAADCPWRDVPRHTNRSHLFSRLGYWIVDRRSPMGAAGGPVTQSEQN